MASQLVEAFTAQYLAAQDPMLQIVKKGMEHQGKAQDVELDNVKLDTMERIQALLKKANEDNADSAVIAAYQKMLARYTS